MFKLYLIKPYIQLLVKLPECHWPSCLILVSLLLSACGGGGGGSTSNNNSNSSSGGSSAASDDLITLTGTISYDFVPQYTQRPGLDYSATQIRPSRGVVVELVNTNNQPLATTVTDSFGRYSFTLAANQLVRVRAKAQLQAGSGQQPGSWDFRVTDNTDNNRLYALVGSLLSANSSTSVRDLHAVSGWDGNSYSQTRAAAPFAILDALYDGLQRLLAVQPELQFPPLELRWSVNNNTASGELTLGEIGTSFFNGDEIYLLGGANEDTDEYDRHVILHEWGHYLEAAFSRSDSIGGEHGGSDKLDFRVAMSEGFANALSAMLLDDPAYRDSSGFQQNEGFQINVNRINNSQRGWYSEASVQSVLYNFYVSDNNKSPRDLREVLGIIQDPNYYDSDALVSIYLFAELLRFNYPSLTNSFNSLLSGQNIALTDRFGRNESNSGGFIGNLPVYKSLSLSNIPVNVCSSNQNGSFNKLGVSQFLLLDVITSGRYEIRARELGADPDASGPDSSDPDLYLYRRGLLTHSATSTAPSSESFSPFLTPGLYVLEVLDARTLDAEFGSLLTTCFDVQAVQIN